ncbi:14021_t:CDS:2 [Entrophospora sp. SA101]|nr:14021_t:CDS:2 [Entrophospora sp. SA101]CAJ0875784.1 22495_t:CDS:2 [Entrophospora sp. SA101]
MCEKVGHFVDSCPESDRLCYNCKQPGHEANQCTQPRTVETKQCYSCGGARNCHGSFSVSREREGGGGRGRGRGRGRGGYVGRGRGRGGYMGGGRGGYMGGGRGGYTGGRGGGRSNDKPGKTCYQCGEVGHISKDCTNELNNDN